MTWETYNEIPFFFFLLLIPFASADIVSINSGGSDVLVVTPNEIVEGFFFGNLQITIQDIVKEVPQSLVLIDVLDETTYSFRIQSQEITVLDMISRVSSIITTLIQQIQLSEGIYRTMIILRGSIQSFILTSSIGNFLFLLRAPSQNIIFFASPGEPSGLQKLNSNILQGIEIGSSLRNILFGFRNITQETIIYDPVLRLFGGIRPLGDILNMNDVVERSRLFVRGVQDSFDISVVIDRSASFFREIIQGFHVFFESTTTTTSVQPTPSVNYTYDPLDQNHSIPYVQLNETLEWP